jgi:mannose-6-phosphate isomerase-like protein (cupin superfamily)
MTGSGSATIGSETAAIKEGDAVPIRLNDRKSFENAGTSPLEFLIVGVARETNRKYDLLPRRGASTGRSNR